MLMKMCVPHYNHVINRNHGSGGDLREDKRYNSSVRPSLHQPGASLSGGFYFGWSRVVVVMAISMDMTMILVMMVACVSLHSHVRKTKKQKNKKLNEKTNISARAL